MLFWLRLRSIKAFLCFGGRNLGAMLRAWISEKEPDDCLNRGRRLRAFGGTLCAICACAASRAIESGEGCGIHSSERSSSHGWVVLAMGTVECCGQLNSYVAPTRPGVNYERAKDILGAVKTSTARGAANNASASLVVVVGINMQSSRHVCSSEQGCVTGPPRDIAPAQFPGQPTAGRHDRHIPPCDQRRKMSLCETPHRLLPLPARARLAQTYDTLHHPQNPLSGPCTAPVATRPNMRSYPAPPFLTYNLCDSTRPRIYGVYTV